MNSLLLLLAVGISALTVVLVYGLASKIRLSTDWPYRKTDYLLTPAERSFFGALSRAVDNNLNVFAKVRLSDLLWLPKGTKNRQSYMNRIQSKHVDFVLCDAATFAPRLLIELDDSSHGKASRRRRDAFIDEAAQHAGLPILHVPVKRSYLLGDLKQVISSLLAEKVETTRPTGTNERGG